MTARTFLLIAVAGALLCGCGQRGALYLPEEDRNVVVKPAPTPDTPAADEAETQRRKDAAPAK